MGRVWLARDEVLRRDVAIKELVVPASLTESERRHLRERAMREARAIARLDQPNVVRIFDVMQDGGEPWIVMEFVPSRSSTRGGLPRHGRPTLAHAVTNRTFAPDLRCWFPSFVSGVRV
jgi:serine/threonine protein kinase